MTQEPWFDDEPPATRPRWRTVLVAAVVPWLLLAVVVLVVVTGGGGSSTHLPTEPPVPIVTDDVPGNGAPSVGARMEGGAAAGVPPGPDGTPPDPDDVAASTGEDGREPGWEDRQADGSSADGDGPDPPAWSGIASTGDAAAVAVAVARAWITDVGPPLPAVAGLRPGRDAYLEHATVQRIEVPADGAAVVTLSVVLLVRDGDRYHEALVRRIAVPLVLDGGGVHPAGTPWWVPGPPLTVRAPDVADVDDPTVAAGLRDAAHHALVHAGFREVEIGRVGLGRGSLAVADVRAVTTEGEVLDGPVWLERDDVAAWRVLGMDAPGAPATSPLPDDHDDTNGDPR